MTFENPVPQEASSEQPGDLKIATAPRVYLVGRQDVDAAAIDQFLADEGATWQTDSQVGAERLAEVAGRVCYMSFGKGRKGNAEYLSHIIEVGHGSVLEHCAWNFIIAGVSRSFTHELVRHRAGFSYSQLSQRYVDESESEFVEPACIAADPKLHGLWLKTVTESQSAYCTLSDALYETFANVTDKTLRRKMARQAARSVLPNATETKIFVTANARALRHFIELRCNEHAETEIRIVAGMVLRIMQTEAPAIFADYRFVDLPDGTQAATTEHRKV